MKVVLVILSLIVVIVVAGYFGLPVLIEKKTAELRTDMQGLKNRVQKIEEESKAAPLKPDANVQEVIKTVNAIFNKMNSLEASLNKGMSQTDGAIKRQGNATEEAFKKQAEAIEKQKTATEEAFKKQSEVIEKTNKEIQERIKKIMFDARMANIRGHILKARIEIVAKNVGTAKNELDLISGAFEDTKALASDENKKTIEEFQTTLKKARTEIDTDLPAALNRIDFLWYEMGKMMRKA
ncbi:MAG: hypothetical protein ABIB41_00465 [Nitrospirota bacterium]